MKEEIIKTIIDFYFNKIKKDSSPNIKYLGKGAFGVSYLINNNYVIKITKNEDEYFFVKKILGKKFKHIADYYNAYILKLNEKLYFLFELEYLKIDCELSRYLDFLIEKIEKLLNIDDIDNLLSFFTTKKEFYDFLMKHAEELDSNDINLKKLFTIALEYYDLNKEVNNISEHTTDLSPNNIGYKKNGNMAVFDVMDIEFNNNLKCDYKIK